jgi:DNA-binding transcriptional LysR family regulator
LVNHEWLFSFVAFADKLNFTRAAEALHISQPALHVQVKKLSEELELPLYRRRGRALVLTAEGERLAAFGRQLQQQEADVMAELRGEETRGPVVLAAGQGAFLYLLGPAIRRFPKERWPLRLLTLKGPEAVSAVRECKAQLGVAVLDEPPADLESSLLCKVGQMAVMPAKHPLARRRSLRPGDLCDEKLVVAPAGSPHRTMLEQAMRAEEATLSVGVEAMGWELMLEFARDGMGIAVVNDLCPIPRGCTAVPVRGLPSASYFLLTRKSLSKAASKLRQLVIEAASKS